MNATIVNLDLERPDRACRGKDLILFFPREGEHVDQLVDRMRPVADYYCRQCPIRKACEQVGRESRYGLWGGVLFRKTYKGLDEIDLLRVDNAVARRGKGARSA